MVDLFAGNVVNSVVHDILMRAVLDKDWLGEKYRKELIASFEVAEVYRNKINPVGRVLPDASEIRDGIVRRVIGELKLRIEKGYAGIDLSVVEAEVDKVLEKLGVL